jgi:hypothetical protein
MTLARTLALGALALLALGAGTVAQGHWRTERTIAGFEAEVARIGTAAPAPAFDAAALAALPEPVRRHLAFVFQGPVPARGVVRLTADGMFRRPGTTGFAPTTAAQVIAIGTPALMFSATTPIAPGLWARAYDLFAGGRMEMQARILSTLTVVNERETPALDRISLRRWLLEASLFPQALLPGGPVAWTALGPDSARATVTDRGVSASMVAHFDTAGRLTHMVAEEEGDLTTPYHGSGEHVTRDDWRLVGGQMIPHRFVISRAAGGAVLPFWDGRITAIRFE